MNLVSEGKHCADLGIIASISHAAHREALKKIHVVHHRLNICMCAPFKISVTCAPSSIISNLATSICPLWAAMCIDRSVSMCVQIQIHPLLLHESAGTRSYQDCRPYYHGSADNRRDKNKNKNDNDNDNNSKIYVCMNNMFMRSIIL